jgi:uncharacterized secreted protein with C-terminal beta-propeller domain
MHTKTAYVLLATLASVAAVGCGSSSSHNGTGTLAATRASLHRAQGCGDLLSDLKADASYKLNRAVDRQIENIEACIRHYSDAQCASYAGFGMAGSGGVAFDAGGAAPPKAAGAPESAPATATPSAAPGASNGTSGGTGGATSDTSSNSTASASSYSDTNTQVKGVDEADIVKNDGKNIYVLHGRSFKVINAWPSTDLREAGTLDIEGDPSEMFVQDGKVVVYSQVNGAAIFSAAGVTPKTQYQEYGYGYGYGYATPEVASGGASTNIAYPAGGAPPTAQPYAPLTKVTVLTLDGTNPIVSREVYFEGGYLDSRRVGQQVRTVLQSYQYGPQLKYSIYELNPPTPVTNAPNMPANGQPYVDPNNTYPKTGSETIAQLEQLRAANLNIIDATQLPDWLPYTFVKDGAVISAQTVACEDFYVPTVGSTQGGMTEIASIDLANPGAVPRRTAILGQANTVYGSADTLYVAANAWVDPPFVWYDQGGAPGVAGGSGGAAGGTAASPPSTGTASPPPAPPVPGGAKPASLTPKDVSMGSPAVVAWSSSRTHIHKFEFGSDPGFPNYVASGSVDGSVKDQFSLDDKDGFLRVATTENRQYVTVDGNYYPAEFTTVQNNNGVPPVHPNTVSHVQVLQQNGPWLDVAGDVGDLAPNEQIRSVRFVDSRGYVVTFRQVDPLFVLDLGVPQTPRVLGALTINGFSEYMHPLDPNHLLTIGRNATATGQVQGLQLQIFDVTDGLKPAVVQRFTYTGQEYGQSDAEYDHKAFTFFDDKKLLAFPYYAYNPTVAGGMRSSLEIFRVDAVDGFAKLGSVDSTPLIQKTPTGYCGGYFGPSVRRGVFLENFVYAISYGGVVVRDSNNLAAPGGQLQLEAPELNTGYGPVCAPVAVGAPTQAAPVPAGG